jgi:hypothetical protein
VTPHTANHPLQQAAGIVFQRFPPGFVVRHAEGGQVLTGLLAVGPRKDIPELWICLPAGLALLGVFAGLAYWLWWRLPRLTVTRFAFDGPEVVIETPARGCFTVPARALRSLSESRGRRGLPGWWLRFEGVGAVFLHAGTPNAAQLIQELQAVATRDRAEPAAATDRRRGQAFRAS